MVDSLDTVFTKQNKSSPKKIQYKLYFMKDSAPPPQQKKKMFKKKLEDTFTNVISTDKKTKKQIRDHQQNW